LPERWSIRAIRYRRRGFREQTLLTSLVDPAQYPRDEIVALYHERWELPSPTTWCAWKWKPRSRACRFVACFQAIKFQLLLFAAISPGKMGKVLERSS